MRLIDADTMFDDCIFSHEWFERELKRFIGDMPTVDAVSVVRCKDCDHASWRDIDGGVWKCKMAMGDEYHDDDYYCA